MTANHSPSLLHHTALCVRRWSDIKITPDADGSMQNMRAGEVCGYTGKRTLVKRCVPFEIFTEKFFSLRRSIFCSLDKETG